MKAFTPTVTSQSVTPQDIAVERAKYSFEKQGRRDPRRSDIEALQKNLQLLGQDGKAPEDLREDLEQNHPLFARFVTHYHSNIEYYDGRVGDELRIQSNYRRLTITLLILIPFVILGVTWLGALLLKSEDSQGFGAAYLTVVITAVLTAILGVHRVFSNWLGQRGLIASFHEARSALKGALFTFEDDWRGKARASDGRLAPDFLKALRRAITDARLIEAAERKRYFEARSRVHPVDLGATLSEAGATAAGLFGRFEAPGLAWRRQREEAARTHAIERSEKDREVKGLAAERERLAAEIRHTTEALDLAEGQRRVDLERKLDELDRRWAEVTYELDAGRLDLARLGGAL